MDANEISPISIWNRPLKYAKYLTDRQIGLLQKGLEIYTIGDLFRHYPFRYEDRSHISDIGAIHLGSGYAQVLGQFKRFQFAGEGKTRRLIGILANETGTIEVIWFQKAEAIAKMLKANTPYLVYGKLNHFNGRSSFTHPEVELFNPAEPRTGLEPIYTSTEAMKKVGLDGKRLGKVISWNLAAFKNEITEPFAGKYMAKWGLMPLPQALVSIHRPESMEVLEKAKERIKTEELFALQFLMLRKKRQNNEISEGHPMPKLLTFNKFYESVLPFPLTGAQKRVLKEIRADLTTGHQMNRLVQGDVGSGKTIVAFMVMLMAIDNGFQACMMAPTEILASQHFLSIGPLAQKVGVNVGLLTGSTKASVRKTIHEDLQTGHLNILIGTHALIENKVQFQRLGLSIVDEQHRFGVAQRASLQAKNLTDLPPHVLVMTATPIPRTLSMALYGDLDISVIDEMPPGRKEIKTVHRTESKRLAVFGFIKDQLEQGRQVYIVYPLIEESEALDLNNLMEGFESISRAFPTMPLSIVHGRMKAGDKDFEMQRFVKGETKIMVATTVIEVGVNVPNASIMVIENAERFGLTQMHQLRGRVGRGAFQSYCILMSGTRLSSDGKMRIETMCRTNNGFEIAETDLKLRGPGDLMGTRQSGIADLKLTNLASDGGLVEQVRQWVLQLIDEDEDLQLPENVGLRCHILDSGQNRTYWSTIS